MGTIEIRPVESRSEDPAGFDALCTVTREIDAERDPDDPPASDREIEADLFIVPPDRTQLVQLATVGGEPAAIAWACTASEPGDELQVSELEVSVRPRFRRNGVATAMIARLVPEMAALGQTSIVSYVCPDVTPHAATALCVGHGLTKRGEERCSRVRVADIDDDLLGGWINDAATGAAGYRLELWEGPCPDELAEPWAVAMAAMEDEPLDDLDYNPYTRSAADQQVADRRHAAAGFRMYRALAVSSSGEPAGITALYVHEDRPQLGHQGDTGVLAGHRGHGLGRWLKAANHRQVVAAHPELAVIETYNAESNPWMLAINVAMGFEPHHTYHSYQAPLATVADAIAGR